MIGVRSTRVTRGFADEQSYLPCGGTPAHSVVRETTALQPITVAPDKSSKQKKACLLLAAASVLRCSEPEDSLPSQPRWESELLIVRSPDFNLPCGRSVDSYNDHVERAFYFWNFTIPRDFKAHLIYDQTTTECREGVSGCAHLDDNEAYVRDPFAANHELTHLVTHAIFGELPSFFDEGLASLLGGPNGPVSLNSPSALELLEYEQVPGTSYTLARQFMDEILRRYGKMKVHEFLMRITSSDSAGDIASAFVEVFDTDISTIEGYARMAAPPCRLSFGACTASAHVVTDHWEFDDTISCDSINVTGWSESEVQGHDGYYWQLLVESSVLIDADASYEISTIGAEFIIEPCEPCGTQDDDLSTPLSSGQSRVVHLPAGTYVFSAYVSGQRPVPVEIMVERL